jgi:hypothetical protein
MEFFVLSTLVLFVIVVFQYYTHKETLLELKELKEKEPEVLVRAKDTKGRFVGNNPETPENEAYVKVPASKAPVAASTTTTTQKRTRRGRKPKSTTTTK